MPKTHLVTPQTIVAGFGAPPRPLTVQEFVSHCLRGRANITEANMATAFAAGVHWCNDGFFRLDTVGAPTHATPSKRHRASRQRSPAR